MKTHWTLIELQNFSQELSHLLASGIPLLSALTLLQQWTSQKNESQFAAQLKSKISRGETFSSAWRALTQENLSSALLLAGDASGRLQEMLQFIFQYAKAARLFRQMLWQALRYPLFLLFLTVGMLALLCVWIIPQFSALYRSFNVKIPPLTQKIMWVGNVLNEHTGIILSIGILFCFILFLFRNKFWRLVKRKFFWLRQSQELKFWQTVVVLLQAGILLDQALLIAINLETDVYFIRNIQYMIRQLQRGEKASAILQSMNIFSPKLIAILGLAQETGRLTPLLADYVAQQTEYLQQGMKSFKAWLEPIFLCVIGGVVGIVLIALYLPIIEFGRWV